MDNATLFSETKRRLLHKLFRGDIQKLPCADQGIRKRLSKGPAPLSLAQEQVWVHAQLAPDIPIYNEPITITRTGPLDVAALKRSLAEIIRRHEIWRTTFDTVEEQPVQIVHPPTDTFELPLVDLRNLPRAERETEALRLATEELCRPFDLKRGPLLRTLLVRVADNDHRLFMVVHHLIHDGMSVYNVFLPELVTFYDLFAAGKQPALPPPPIQYADYATWQRAWVREGGLVPGMQYWRNRLAGAPPALQWPNDNPRPPVQTFHGAMQPLAMPLNLVEALRVLARKEGVTLFITLLSGFLALLHRYTGEEDIVIGTVTAGRDRPEIERVLGYFLNPLPLRTSLSGNPSFRELLGRVRDVVSGAVAHSNVPFLQLVKEMAEHNPSRSPIFQIMLSLEPPAQPFTSGWDLNQTDVTNGASKVDLFLDLDERQDRIIGPITYNPDLFDASTITRMMGHWQTLLASVSADPELRIADLPILTEGERDQVVVEWNDTRMDCPRDLCVHELIEAQVERTPEASAIVCEQNRLSYRDLDERANKLAGYLRKRGVRPDILVGICMERSIEMIIALLGILKAGGAYIPLDPNYPEERLRMILDDSRAPILLTERHSFNRLPNSPAQVICTDANWEDIRRENSTKPDRVVTPQNLAYTIYTSGSTGRPKGVQIEHSSVVNFLTSMCHNPGIAADDVLLAVTTLSFDIAGLELYLPLTMGATVVIASREDASDGTQLLDLLDRCQATVMQATPTTWRMLLEAGWKGDPKLRVLCGGEALPPDLARELLPRCAALWNMYGPTETTIWSSAYKVTPDVSNSVFIGRPIANTTMYVLDRKLCPVPIGIAGELYIGGAGVARGYLKRPELTGERFIPNPFPQERGTRLYRTGDLVRFRADGNLEFLGRLDSQVKIRGFRIETGEIETVLREHPAIRDAVVIVRENSRKEPCLVAYIVHTPMSTPSLEEIRGYLKNKLPSYMIPALIILDKLPLTPNGKLNLRVLPPPEHIELEETFEEPQDTIEQLLAELWAEVLKVKRVGAYDNFFDLGGHSLSAVQVVARLQDRLGLRIRPNELAFQTLRQLAANCRERLGDQLCHEN